MSNWGFRAQSWPNGRAMAWELDAVSSEYLPKYPTPNVRMELWETWLSCTGNSTMYRSNPNQISVSKLSMLWARKAGSAALTEFNQ
ncbi:Uncharacterized protein APZ42_019553 [Daphnia magna]|uniref:Uncharacterized protein n=1 Tax=Daphnia magna TaxID=35525 RepID=A0A164Y8K9_9CRUS|nr:Uncharacterized protein APZ42_019553 [Daphnia magna]